MEKFFIGTAKTFDPSFPNCLMINPGTIIEIRSTKTGEKIIAEISTVKLLGTLIGHVGTEKNIFTPKIFTYPTIDADCFAVEKTDEIKNLYCLNN